MDLIPEFLDCPRCGDRGFERLQSYSHCVACLYSPVFEEEPSVPEWAAKYAKKTTKAFSEAQACKEHRNLFHTAKAAPKPVPHAFRIEPTTAHVFNDL